MMQILALLYSFKIVKHIIANFLYAFAWQFMKSSEVGISLVLILCF